MNNFTQDNLTNLIGQKKDIENLANKEKARILVVSDSHGHPSVLKSIVQDFGSECDAMVFCGDGIEDIAFLAESADAVPSVLGIAEGNNDPDSYFIKGQAIKVPLNCSLIAAGHNIFFTHGHRFALYDGLDRMKEAAQSIGCSAVFFGHTHVAFSALIPGNVFVLNPGSCSRPRQCQCASFAIVEVEKDKNDYNAVFYQAIPGERKTFVPESIFL